MCLYSTDTAFAQHLLSLEMRRRAGLLGMVYGKSATRGVPSAQSRKRLAIDLGSAVEIQDPFDPGHTSTPTKAGNNVIALQQSPVVLQNASFNADVDITGSEIDCTTVGDSSFIVSNGEVTILQSDHESSDCDDDSSDDISNASITLNSLGDALKELDEDLDTDDSLTDSEEDEMYYREEEPEDEINDLCCTVNPRRIQPESAVAATVVSNTVEKTSSVYTQTVVSDFPSSSETDSSLAPLQPVPCVKTALRASQFNRLEDQNQLKKEVTLIVGTKVICSLDLLLQLFMEKCRHPGCQLGTTVQHTLCGTSVLIKWKCSAGHAGKFWSSHKVNGMLANNLQACAAILLSGNNFAQVERFAKFLGLAFASSSTFCRAQRVYCIPAINEWWTWQQGIINQELQGHDVVVMGDGQCDSPGFTAKNLCYFLMEMTTSSIWRFLTRERWS